MKMIESKIESKTITGISKDGSELILNSFRFGFWVKDQG